MSENVKTHELKIWPQYFNKKLQGVKSWEHRRNDRNFKVGENMLLREWSPQSGRYTGETMLVNILLIHDLEDGTVIISDDSEVTALRSKIAELEAKVGPSEFAIETLEEWVTQYRKATAKAKIGGSIKLSDCPDGSILVDGTLDPVVQKRSDLNNDLLWFDMYGDHVKSVSQYCKIPTMKDIELFLYMGPFEKVIPVDMGES
jgi:hypothetical protein